MAKLLPYQAITGLVAELLVWLGATGIFLYLYVFKFDAPQIAALLHLKILSIYWLLWVGLRVLNWVVIPTKILPRLLASLLIFLPWLAMAIWYLLVFAGLSSWGRVTTWPLIKTYAIQSPYLLETFALPVWLLLGGIALVFVLPLALIFYGSYKIDWTRYVASLSKPPISALGAITLAALSISQIFQFTNSPLNKFEEPLSLSFFPNEGIKAHQSHIFGSDRILQSKELVARRDYRTRDHFERRNVILIVGDALRADHMGVYGYSRSTTPFLAKRAAKHNFIAVPNMRSVCAESSCGLLGLASSRPVHAMVNQPFTLHEVLRLHGYKVRMILSGDHTNFYGLKEAYGTVDSYSDGTDQTARYINDDLLLLDRVDALPAFNGLQGEMLQFHMMSTHGLGMRHAQADKFSPYVNYYRWPKAGIPPSPSEIQKGINYYDNGMVQFDQIVERLLVTLESKGYLDNAVVVITGDHGEGLGEHGRFSHAHQVFESSLGIPMIVIRHGYKGASLGYPRISSQIDIAPTILTELGIPPPQSWQGLALQNKARHDYLSFQQSNIVGLYDLRGQTSIKKYWKDLKTQEENVYDLSNDPLEKRNILDKADAEHLSLWRRMIIPGGFSVPGPPDP